MLRAIFFGTFVGSEFSEPINELGVTAAIARSWLVRSRHRASQHSGRRDF